MKLLETFGAITALHQKSISHSNFAQALFEIAGLSGKYERRITF